MADSKDASSSQNNSAGFGILVLIGIAAFVYMKNQPAVSGPGGGSFPETEQQLSASRERAEQSVRKLNSIRGQINWQSYNTARQLYDQAQLSFNSGIDGLALAVRSRGNVDQFVATFDEGPRVALVLETYVNGLYNEATGVIVNTAGPGPKVPQLEVAKIGFEIVMKAWEASQKADADRRAVISQSLEGQKWKPFEHIQ